tara:strand:- start:1745 stop:3037 length:1293 start_codon:yes stop_codon:yes gene_type:complete
MKTKLKNKNSFTKSLSVEVPWKDLEADYQKVFDRMKSNYTPPGGRKGKVFGIHLDLFKKNYTSSIEAQFAEDSISKYYKEAIDELKLAPINQGKILDLQFKEQNKLKFDIEFEIKPEFKLPKYDKKFKVKAIKYIPSDQDLTDALTDLQNRFSTMKEITGGASEGNYLLVDMQELDNGAPIIGKKMEKQYIRLGFGAFNNDALTALSGIKKDQKRNVSLEIQGNHLQYELFAHKVEEQIIPELNDEFAKTVDPNCKNLKSLKAKISDNIDENFETEHLKAVNNAIIDYFVEKTKLEAPDSMIANYLDHLIENNKAQQPNMTDEKEKEVRASSRDAAIMNIKWYLIKESIINQQGIDVSNDDFEKRKKELIEKDPQNAKNIKVFLKDSNNQQRFFEDILNEKLFNYLKDFAIIKVDKKKSDELRKMKGESK